MDWVRWHSAYADPASSLSQRLLAVQAQIRAALTAAPAGPIPVVSMCAGEGRDLLGVLADHPRAADVSARLVELDPVLCESARVAAEPLPSRVEVVTADAGWTDPYVGAVPARLALFCGVFGNISDVDVAATVAAAPSFVAPGGMVVWTRHRGAPDLVPQICEWFESAGFEQVFVSPRDARFGLGVHRFVGAARPLVAGHRLFAFQR
ncbi:SAM-dependent methyltransferase [Asanoa sp. NPDC049573]|uniref:SAM-dependent methyltransferase n=1 Tax=Asanoa sp. NPDC049573 TaxID=3155396 RepID=UPI00341DB397